MNRFIESVLYYYFCYKDGKEYSDEGIITSKIPYDPAEVFDAFEKKTNVDTKELKKLANSEKRFRIPELDPYNGPVMYRYPLKIKTEDMMAWCKPNGASPTTALAAIMSKMIAKENNVQEGVIMSVVPFSLRKYLHADKSYKNCASAIFMPATPA